MQLLGKMAKLIGWCPSLGLVSGKSWIHYCKFLQTEITLTHIHLRSAAQLVVLHSDPKSNFMIYLSPSVASVSKCRERLGFVSSIVNVTASIVLTDTLKDTVGVQPILPIEVSITIDTMLNFGCDFDEYGDGNGTCKQIFTINRLLTASTIL